MNLLEHFLTWLRTLDGPTPEPASRPDLIIDVSVLVRAKCPCGSQIEHVLTLYSTSECPRCGLTIGIRKLDFFRRGTAHLPDANISIGYLRTTAGLENLPTPGPTH